MPDFELRIVATTAFEGGAEKYIAELARLLHEDGAAVSLLGDLRTWPSFLPQKSIGNGSKWSLRTLPIGILRLPLELRRLRRVTQKTQGAVYNLHFKREQIAFSKILSKSGRVVWTEHGRFPKGLFGLLIGPFYRRSSQFADAVVCVSPLVAKDIADRVASRDSVRVIDTAIDLNRFSVPSPERRNELKKSVGFDTRPVVAYVGRLEDDKRPGLAIRGGLAAGAQVVVAGTGSQYGALMKEFEHASDVTFLGQVKESAEIYAMADVHVFSSNGAGEGFPTVILESAASGVPTVAAADSGFTYAVEAAGGVSVAASEGKLAQAIGLVLDSLEARRSAARSWAESRDQVTWTSSYRAAFLPPA
ncbi:glycosyltransferase family 4 protein [Pseudarthrobacter oxydans]|uniref:glycosyltransferase family 4 protein n=1 Tax=Pseudarthrobacter oxydans TaxID=1671 RepID=UPI00366B2051